MPEAEQDRDFALHVGHQTQESIFCLCFHLWGCCLNRARTVRAPCAHRASFCVFCVHQIHNA